MLFSSMTFLWLFLPVTFLLERLLRAITGNGNVWSNCLLLVASLIFYAWGEPVYVLLMLASITVNWVAGLLVDSLPQGSARRRMALVGTICIDLAVLGWFKYAGMTINTINQLFGAAFPNPGLALPIGISFFTFQALSYVIDVYRSKCEVQRNWVKLALYISFFPQLIAGPIVQYRDVCDQIENRRTSLSLTASGLRRFAYGLSKKVLISNACGACADAIFALPVEQAGALLAWTASVSYMIQIYFDFSGYSDMAIGLGRIFGFEFCENFDHPYLSKSIREFWQRWHISLGSWFREYVYIPLGGNRKGVLRTYANLFAVFFLTGLWHGASWSFVAWGLWHGLFSILERSAFGKWLERHGAIAVAYTLAVVLLGWVLFRVEDIGLAARWCKRMLLPWQYGTAAWSVWEFVNGRTMVAAICGIVGSGPLQALATRFGLDETWKGSWAEIGWLAMCSFFSILGIVGGTYNPFIYFKF